MIPLLLALLACGPKQEARTYDASLFDLATAYNAKMTCSCLFVSGRDQDSCAQYVKVSPAIARAKVDLEARTVTSRALGGWKRTARFVDDELGCQLDPLD